MHLNVTLPKPKRYYQETQDRNCRFAFGKFIDAQNVEALFYPVRCRDFLIDVVLWDKKVIKPETVYGFSFKGEIDQHRTILVVTGLRGFKGDLGPIHELDDIFGFKRTEVFEGRYGNNNRMPCWVFVADKGWQEKTVMISLLSNVIREKLYVHRYEHLDPNRQGMDGLYFSRYRWGWNGPETNKKVTWPELAKLIKHVNPGVSIYDPPSLSEYHNGGEIWHNYNGTSSFLASYHNKYSKQVEKYFA